MTPGDALLLAALGSPADDTPRLVYSDWLEESGAAWAAELVRLQCAWRKVPYRRRRDRAPLETRAAELLAGDDGPLAPLCRAATVRRPALTMDPALILFLHAAAGGAPAADPLRAGSVWRGELSQTYQLDDTSAGHPTRLTVTERDGAWLRARMRQDFSRRYGYRCEGHFSCEGAFAAGHLAFVTAKVRGPVMVPGLFVAPLKGDELRGRWEVRWANADGAFFLRRAGR
jgi:uncharacterized protein (TIGR02996 family)